MGNQLPFNIFGCSLLRNIELQNVYVFCLLLDILALGAGIFSQQADVSVVENGAVYHKIVQILLVHAL